MSSKDEKVSIAKKPRCAGLPCNFELRIVSGGWPDVTITSVELTALDWNTGNVVPGTQTTANVSSLHRELLGSIRERLGLQRSDNQPEPRITDYGDCSRECYCYIPANAQPTNEAIQTENFEWEFSYVHSLSMSKTGNIYRNGATGQIITPQGHQHVEGPIQMNPGLSMTMSWKLLTRYKAKIKLKVKYKEYELGGECTEYPVEGGFLA